MYNSLEAVHYTSKMCVRCQLGGAPRLGARGSGVAPDTARASCCPPRPPPAAARRGGHAVHGRRDDGERCSRAGGGRRAVRLEPYRRALPELSGELEEAGYTN